MKTRTQFVTATKIKTSTLVGVGVIASIAFMAAAVGTAPSGGKTPAPTIQLQMFAPNGGESWKTGQEYNVEWCVNSSLPTGSKVISYLLKGRKVVASDIIKDMTKWGYAWCPSHGMNQWTVPASLSPGNDYKIKIAILSSTGKEISSDTSDNNFSVIPYPWCNVTLNKSEVFRGLPVTGSWSTYYDADGKIDYICGDGSYLFYGNFPTSGTDSFDFSVAHLDKYVLCSLNSRDSVGNSYMCSASVIIKDCVSTADCGDASRYSCMSGKCRLNYLSKTQSNLTGSYKTTIAMTYSGNPSNSCSITKNGTLASCTTGFTPIPSAQALVNDQNILIVTGSLAGQEVCSDYINLLNFGTGQAYVICKYQGYTFSASAEKL